MYFMMIRPQQKQVKEHKAMLAALKKGDEVVTQGGMLGKISARRGQDGDAGGRRRREGAGAQDLRPGQGGGRRSAAAAAKAEEKEEK